MLPTNLLNEIASRGVRHCQNPRQSDNSEFASNDMKQSHHAASKVAMAYVSPINYACCTQKGRQVSHILQITTKGPLCLTLTIYMCRATISSARLAGIDVIYSLLYVVL